MIYDELDTSSLGSHHKPRKIDKRKHHARGFSEDYAETRKSRITFKKYVQSLKEQELDSHNIDE